MSKFHGSVIQAVLSIVVLHLTACKANEINPGHAKSEAVPVVNLESPQVERAVLRADEPVRPMVLDKAFTDEVWLPLVAAKAPLRETPELANRYRIHTGIQIQVTKCTQGRTSADPTVTFYRPDGSRQNVFVNGVEMTSLGDRGNNIGVGKSSTLWPLARSETSWGNDDWGFRGGLLPDGFMGSARITANGCALSVLVNNFSSNDYLGDPNAAMDTYNGITKSASRLVVPNVIAVPNSADGFVSVLNLGNESTTIRAAFMAQDGTHTATATFADVPSYGTRVVSASQYVPGPFWSGSVIISNTSTAPLLAGVSVNQAYRSGAIAPDQLFMQPVQGDEQASDVVYAPLVSSRNYRNNTEIYVANTTDNNAKLTLSFSNNTHGYDPTQSNHCAVGPGTILTESLPANGSKQLLLPLLSGFSNCGYVGAVKIEATDAVTSLPNPIVASVRQQSTENATGSSYPGFTLNDAGTRVTVPLVMFGNWGWFTGINIYNVSGETNGIRVEFSPSQTSLGDRCRPFDRPRANLSTDPDYGMPIVAGKMQLAPGGAWTLTQLPHTVNPQCQEVSAQCYNRPCVDYFDKLNGLGLYVGSAVVIADHPVMVVANELDAQVRPRVDGLVTYKAEPVSDGACMNDEDCATRTDGRTRCDYEGPRICTEPCTNTTTNAGCGPNRPNCYSRYEDGVKLCGEKCRNNGMCTAQGKGEWCNHKTGVCQESCEGGPSRAQLEAARYREDVVSSPYSDIAGFSVLPPYLSRYAGDNKTQTTLPITERQRRADIYPGRTCWALWKNSPEFYPDTRHREYEINRRYDDKLAGSISNCAYCEAPTKQGEKHKIRYLWMVKPAFYDTMAQDLLRCYTGNLGGYCEVLPF